MIKPTKRYLFPFILITSLFFFWGFIHNLDPVLIAHLRKTFQLTNFQSSLVDSAVYIAYFLIAIPAGWVMKKYGYKAGIVLGLLLFSLGAFLFVPAANTHAYPLFLGALFIVASGLTFLETAANPYVTILGAPETAAFRLNLAQSFNGLAAAMAPLVGKYLILSKQDFSNEQILAMSADARQLYVQAETNSVKLPFIVLGIILLVVALAFIKTKLPDIKEEDGVNQKRGLLKAFVHKHLRWAVTAQFFYVGAQVCVNSFFILFAAHAARMNNLDAADYLIAYGIAFMLGRFAGTFLMRRFIQPQRLLALYSVVNILLSLIAIFGTGIITLYALIGIAFFMSIMFPTIFALGIKDLGADTKSGSSLLIMSIIGGALLPLLLGYIADAFDNIQIGYVVPLCCFVVILWFALKGYKTQTAS
ncbi:MAG: L-fucose:H+ symporter permease [Sphingobacteriales bacterium]|nr:MAG: L-fucose:H+ symporter permease [Sphingobacteriales bacterium]